MAASAQPVSVLVEGLTDEVIIRRILEFVSVPCGAVYGKQGKAYVLSRLASYDRAARYSRWLVVADLDRDWPCAPAFVATVLPDCSDGMLFRVAVRAIESWLLADSTHLATFMGVSVSQIPAKPDAEEDPKAVLVDLARRSRWRSVREGMAPRPGSSARVGPRYPAMVIEFVATAAAKWRPEVALHHSDSLRRCVYALRVAAARP